MNVSELEIQANRLDLLSRMAGDISHEIKNPLHAMVINLELVRRRIEKDEGAGALDRVDVIEGEIRKVNSLSIALLEALRPPRDRAEASDFTAVLMELLPLFTARARLARLELTSEIEAGALSVALRVDRLRQVVLNVMDIALSDTTEHESILLRARGTPEGAELDVRYTGRPMEDARMAWLNSGEDGRADLPLGLRVLRELVVGAAGSVRASAGDGECGLRVVLPMG